jgi:hypothetical protein
MTFYNVVMDLIRFVPKFWVGVIEFFQYRLPIPEPLMYYLDPSRGPMWKFFLTIVIYFVLYVIVSRLIYKLSWTFIFTPINDHMSQYNFCLVTNIILYLLALVCIIFDVLMVATAGLSEGATSGFWLFSMVLMIIAAIRALIITKLRFFYLQPLQYLFFAFLYIMALLAFPALVMYFAASFGGGLSSAMGSSGYKCEGCGRVYKRAVTCSCGSSAHHSG